MGSSVRADPDNSPILYKEQKEAWLDSVFLSRRSYKCSHRVMFSQVGLGESLDLSKRPSLIKLDSLLQEVCIINGQGRASMPYSTLFLKD